jgi:hypothetical protein
VLDDEPEVWWHGSVVDPEDGEVVLDEPEELVLDDPEGEVEEVPPPVVVELLFANAIALAPAIRPPETTKIPSTCLRRSVTNPPLLSSEEGSLAVDSLLALGARSERDKNVRTLFSQWPLTWLTARAGWRLGDPMPSLVPPFT